MKIDSKTPHRQPERGRLRADVVRRLDLAPTTLARFASALGLVCLLDVLLPHHRGLLAAVVPATSEPAGAAADAMVAVAGLGLLRVAAGLRRGKRIAWWTAAATSSAITLANVIRGERRDVEALAGLLLLSALVVSRHRFTAITDRRSRRLAHLVAGQFVLAGVVWASVLAHFSARGDAAAMDTFHDTVLGFGLLAVASWVVLMLRPSQPVSELRPPDETRLRALLAQFGERDSLGYFALRRDKSIIFSPSGKSAILYRVVTGVALISGDPIGEPEAWPAAMDAFNALVERNGWTPAVMACSERGATEFRRCCSLTALAVGDEAIVAVKDWCLDGREMRGVRQACARVERAGVVLTVRPVADLDAGELGELRAAGCAWRGDAVERGFSMALSRLGDPADRACVVVSARLEGRLIGLLHFVPWGTRGLSLDLMRRERSAPNGLNEFMITELIRSAASLGIERVSLNFAVFRDALDRGSMIGAGPVLRLWRRVLLLGSRWWQIDSLYRFNAKFRPRWYPRFICYPTVRDIPRVALAALEAEAFVVRPRLSVTRGRRG